MDLDSSVQDLTRSTAVDFFSACFTTLNENCRYETLAYLSETLEAIVEGVRLANEDAVRLPFSSLPSRATFPSPEKPQ